jgi:hypothetical protein
MNNINLPPLITGQVWIGNTGGPAVPTNTTGTGDVVRATSPVLVTPALGTPSSGDLSNCTGVVHSVSGTANQVNFTAGANPVGTLSSTLIAPGTVTLNADPVTALQAATKQYVDAVASLGLDFKASVVASTTTALTATYANGTLGVGATLTNSGAQAAFATDGITPTVGARILVKNQSSTFQNGIYTLTNAGSVSTNWVLTRATDFDTAVEIQPGSFVAVDTGTTLALTSFLQTATVALVGTDAVLFSQFTYGTSFPSLSVSGNITNAALTASKMVLTNGSKVLGSSSLGESDLLAKISQTAAQIYAADSVGTDAYAITLSPAIAAYTAGMQIIFKAGTANTGNATLNVNGVGALNILKNHDQTLATNDIEVGQIVTVVYDGTLWQMTSQLGNTSIGPSTPGVVVQVQSATLTTTATNTSATYADTGLTVSITPSSATSKIYVNSYLTVGADSGYGMSIRLVRDSTTLCVGDAAGSRVQCSAGSHGDAAGGIETSGMSFQDAPATTSAVVYKIQFAVNPGSAGGGAYINRSAIDTNSASFQRGASTITVMEVTG